MPRLRSGSPRLIRTLGPLALTFYGVGAIIGAGVYSVMGQAAGLAGRSLWISMVLAAFAAGLTALSYCELSTWRPRAGAEYHYLRAAAPGADWASFTIGVVVALTGATTAATVALAFGGYIGQFVNIPIWVPAAGLLTACTALSIVGVKESTRATIILTSIEVSGLVLVIGLALYAGVDIGAPLTEKPDFSAVLPAAALCFFVYTGFEGLANMAEESRKPERDLPIGLLAALAITTVLYILVALSIVGLAAPEALAGSKAPLALAVGGISTDLAAVMAVLALVATASTALITLVVGARVLFGMAREGDLPSLLAKSSDGSRTPWVAALGILAVSLALVPLGRVEVVANISSLLTLLTFVAINVALIILRYRRPRDRRPFRTPFNVGQFPMTPLLAIIVSLGLMTQFEPTAYVVSAIVLVAVSGVYVLSKQERKKRV